MTLPETNEMYKALERANQLKKAWDYQAFVIDPWNSLAKDKNKLKGTIVTKSFDKKSFRSTDGIFFIS